MLKEDRNGQYVTVYTYANGDVIRKYEYHIFRKYTVDSDYNSEGTEMKWDKLPDEVQREGEQYDIVYTDETDPYKPEIREYVRYPLRERSGRVIRQMEQWETSFLKFQIWRQEGEGDSFDKKVNYAYLENENQASDLKAVWEGKKASWETYSKYKPNMDSRDWHQQWERDNRSLDKWIKDTRKNVKLLCDLLLEHR
jgi:hypothetical protein